MDCQNRIGKNTVSECSLHYWTRCILQSHKPCQFEVPYDAHAPSGVREKTVLAERPSSRVSSMAGCF